MRLYEMLAVVQIKNPVFWDMTPCSLIHG